MGTGVTEVNQITIAALTVPIVVLVVTLSVDSVEKQDSVDYRVGVGSLGLATIISAFLLIGVAVVGEFTGELALDLFVYLFFTFLSALILVVYVLLHELARGINPESRPFQILWNKLLRVAISVFAFYGVISIYQSPVPNAVIIPFIGAMAALVKFAGTMVNSYELDIDNGRPNKKLAKWLLLFGLTFLITGLSWAWLRSGA